MNKDPGESRDFLFVCAKGPMMKTTAYAAVVLAAVACKDTSYGLFNHSATACVCTSRFVEMLPSVFRFAMVVYNTVQRCFLRQHDKEKRYCPLHSDNCKVAHSTHSSLSPLTQEGSLDCSLRNVTTISTFYNFLIAVTTTAPPVFSRKRSIFTATTSTAN
jgi:hypothetical protein